MARPRIAGAWVPLVTPFRNGSVDDQTLRSLIEQLISGGASGMVPCGTTGESPTLSHDEHKRVIELTIKSCMGKVPVMAGTGSNSTSEAIELTQHAERAGADSALLVVPYYNRPSQAGLISHFRQVAAQTSLPLVLYNIPKRTGVNLDAASVIELSKVDNIVGIKEASGDMGQIMDIIAGAREFSVLTGDDQLLFAMCCLGGAGGILACAHVLPGEWMRIVSLVEQGKIAEARALHYRMLPLVKALFSETNPVPVKAALELMGIPVGPPRPPLLPASEACRQRVAAELRRLGVIQ
jgi:4-hydroxy-tetrahydrodipicolinate synthase